MNATTTSKLFYELISNTTEPTNLVASSGVPFIHQLSSGKSAEGVNEAGEHTKKDNHERVTNTSLSLTFVLQLFRLWLSGVLIPKSVGAIVRVSCSSLSTASPIQPCALLIL